jgi:hypothetical protein
MELYMRKGKRSHPLRFVAVDMMRSGEATPTDIRRVLFVPRQLVSYWRLRAGLKGKPTIARDQYLARRMLRNVPPTENPELEHEAIRRLRKRLERPRPSQAQMERARLQKITNLGDDHLPELPSASEKSNIS